MVNGSALPLADAKAVNPASATLPRLDSRTTRAAISNSLNRPATVSGKALAERLNSERFSDADRRQFVETCETRLIPALRFLDLDRMEAGLKGIEQLQQAGNDPLLAKLVSIIRECSESLSIEIARSLQESLKKACDSLNHPKE